MMGLYNVKKKLIGVKYCITISFRRLSRAKEGSFPPTLVLCVQLYSVIAI